MQPAITRVGTTVVIFWNRMIAANTDYQVYYRTLSNGSLSAPQLLDGTGGFKGYPAAAETLPSTVPAVACAYGKYAGREQRRRRIACVRANARGHCVTAAAASSSVERRTLLRRLQPQQLRWPGPELERAHRLSVTVTDDGGMPLRRRCNRRFSSRASSSKSGWHR